MVSNIAYAGRHFLSTDVAAKERPACRCNYCSEQRHRNGGVESAKQRRGKGEKVDAGSFANLVSFLWKKRAGLLANPKI